MSWYHNMSARQRWELLAVVFVVLLGLSFALPAILHARAGVRDDLRRTDIAQLKRSLENYNNQLKSYPAAPANTTACTGSAERDSWFFGDTSVLLKNKVITAIPHDLQESPTQQYRYCVTNVTNDQATGFFLEARLEIPQPATTIFDEDEGRKYYARTLTDQGQTLYRVCGGTETQCGTSTSK